MSTSFDPLEIYRVMARYNSHMNAQLLAECSKFANETRKAPHGVPFDSLHGLWNHLLLANGVWMARFTNQPIGVTSLNQELFAGWRELCDAHREMDERIERLIATRDAEILGLTFRWTSMSNPQPREIPFFVALSHLFNHQTHHRGQAHGMLSGSWVRPPQLDEFFAEEEAPLRAGEFAALGWTEEGVWAVREG